MKALELIQKEIDSQDLTDPIQNAIAEGLLMAKRILEKETPSRIKLEKIEYPNSINNNNKNNFTYIEPVIAGSLEKDSKKISLNDIKNTSCYIKFDNNIELRKFAFDSKLELNDIDNRDIYIIFYKSQKPLSVWVLEKCERPEYHISDIEIESLPETDKRLSEQCEKEVSSLILEKQNEQSHD